MAALSTTVKPKQTAEWQKKRFGCFFMFGDGDAFSACVLEFSTVWKGEREWKYVFPVGDVGLLFSKKKDVVLR